jgi:hypothetical protein
MAYLGEADSERLWAERQARRLLEPLGARWRHTQGVAKRAQKVGRALALADADMLVAAAFLHDVGYAPSLRETGLHPLDGAQFVRACGCERLAGLVAYHGSARAEAIERGLRAELGAFKDERSVVSRALTYCDLTSDSEGRFVEPAERFAGIRRRYGPESPEVLALTHSIPSLLDDVRMVESMMSVGRPAIEVGGGSRR